MMGVTCILVFAVMAAIFCYVMAGFASGANNEWGRKFWLRLLFGDVIVGVVILAFVILIR